MRIEEIKPRLKAIRASTQELADFMGVEHHIADNIVNVRRKHLRQTEVDQIRRFFELRERPLYPEAGERPTLPDRPQEFQDRSTGRAEIALYGGADTKDGWMISLAMNNQVGRVMAHPKQMTARRAFAVEVVDDTMSPRFNVAEIAYVSAGQMPAQGQDCLVEFGDLTGRILQFVERDNKRLILRQLNPAKQVILQANDTLKLHAIVGRG